MSDWLRGISHSLTNQAGTWFVGFVLAILGVFSGRLVESLRFAVNRADLRSKYYEQMAIDISHFVFIIDRLIKVNYGSSWASDDDKSAIAIEYNEVANGIFQREYVYLSWLHRYWGKDEATAFVLVMDKIRDVDMALINLNEHGAKKERIAALEQSFRDLKAAAHTLLMQA